MLYANLSIQEIQNADKRDIACRSIVYHGAAVPPESTVSNLRVCEQQVRYGKRWYNLRIRTKIRCCGVGGPAFLHGKEDFTPSLALISNEYGWKPTNTHGSGSNRRCSLTLVILGDEQQLWPGEDMIEVVLHLVVFRKTPQVRRLHLDEVIHGCLADGEGHGPELSPKFLLQIG